MLKQEELQSVIKESSALSKAGRHGEALALITRAMSRVTPDSESNWVKILSRHGAAIARASGNLNATQHFVEQLLVHSPEDVTALYALADVLRRQGLIDQARQQAIRCYITAQRNPSSLSQGVTDLVLDGWPDLFKDQNR